VGDLSVELRVTAASDADEPIRVLLVGHDPHYDGSVEVDAFGKLYVVDPDALRPYETESAGLLVGFDPPANDPVLNHAH
jgi:hypothetical protein